MKNELELPSVALSFPSYFINFDETFDHVLVKLNWFYSLEDGTTVELW